MTSSTYFASMMTGLFLPCALFAQSASIDPPKVGLPVDFSNVVGKYDIRATAAPTQVKVEQTILLQIVITGKGPAEYEPKREFLNVYPKIWEKDFYIEEMRDEHRVDRDNKTWTFVYRLKPKHTNINFIDGIKLAYWDHLAKGEKKRTKYVDSIPLVVKSASEIDEPAVDPAAPKSFYQNFPLGDHQACVSDFSLPLLVMASFLAGVPLVCLLGAFVWRKCHPNESERRRRLRSRAAVHAIEQLRTAERPVWLIVTVYLCERFDLTVEDPTPTETAAMLSRRGIAKPLCAAWKTLLVRCDALRYGSTTLPASSSLTEEAMRLIAALEADPCAH